MVCARGANWRLGGDAQPVDVERGQHKLWMNMLKGVGQWSRML